MGIPAIPNRRDPQFGDEKMNNNGKFASALAVFAVVACLLMAVPSVEATGDGTSAPEEIGADGFLALAQDGVLTLQKDYVLTSALAVEDELTIDLNGHSIVNSDANANHTIDVSETGKLTIEDSVGTGTVDNVTHAKAAIMNDGEVVLEGGKFTRSLESASNTYYVIDNHGTLTIHDGVTVSKTSEEQHSSMIRNADGATLTIQGGTFESGKDIAVKNDTGGVLRIYDGTFTPAKISTDFAVQNWGTATIMGGTFKGIVASMSDDENASSMTVENGTFSGKVLAWNFVDNYVSGMDPADNAASVVINGGNFSTPASNYAAIIGGTGSTFLVTDPTIASYVINGGTFGSNVSAMLQFSGAISVMPSTSAGTRNRLIFSTASMPFNMITAHTRTNTAAPALSGIPKSSEAAVAEADIMAKNITKKNSPDTQRVKAAALLPITHERYPP